jgi:hypothetical protein
MGKPTDLSNLRDMVKKRSGIRAETPKAALPFDISKMATSVFLVLLSSKPRSHLFAFEVPLSDVEDSYTGRNWLS